MGLHEVGGRKRGSRRCLECTGIHVPGETHTLPRGLPFDCPGCLAFGSIERTQYGKGTGQYKQAWKLTCAECSTVYYWNEGKDAIPV